MSPKSKLKILNKNNPKKKRGLWYNIHKKRIQGRKMRPKGAKGAPTEAAIKRSQA
jgi:hypothetical protein|tara:strand:+ start:1559 stop:1723 length:165 start_codon:yes stop_codon:yes gene_type:complete